MNYKLRDDELIRLNKLVNAVGNNSGNVGYSQKALNALTGGNYLAQRKSSLDAYQAAHQPQVPQLQPAQNLSEKGFPSTVNTQPIDFDYVLENDEIFGNPGFWGGFNRLEDDLKNYDANADVEEQKKSQENFVSHLPFMKGAVDQANEEAARIEQMYYNRFGKSKDQVLREYKAYKEAKEQVAREEHPFLSGIKDYFTAPDRAIASAAGNLVHMAFPESDLDKMLNSDTALKKVKEVQKQRDYAYNSDKLSPGKKTAVKAAYEGGDFLVNLALAALTGGSSAGADVASGTGFIYEAEPWVRPTLNAVSNYGLTSASTQHDLEQRGVDKETARQMANASGGIAAAAGALMASGNVIGSEGSNWLTSALMSGAKAGGISLGQQGAQEIASKMILDDQSNYDSDVRNYISQGMSEEDAQKQAAENILIRMAGSGATGFVAGAGLSALSTGVGKLGNAQDALNEYTTFQKGIGQNGGEIPALPMNETGTLTGANYPMLPENQLPAIPLTGTNGVIPLGDNLATTAGQTAANAVPTVRNLASIPNKVVAESRSANPRYVQPLEGEALKTANAKVKTNRNKINAIKNEIQVLENDKSNYWRGKLKKSVQADINARKDQIKALEQENTATRKEIKGGIKPVKEMLPENVRNGIYSNKTGVYTDINYAVKFAGDTPEAKQLGKEAKQLLDTWVESGDMNDYKAFYMKVADLDALADATRADYVSKRGTRTSYDGWYGTYEDGEPMRLLDSILLNKNIGKVSDFHRELNAQMPAETPITGEGIAEVPKAEPAVVEEIMKRNVGKVRPYINQTPEGSTAEAALMAERIGLPLTEEEQAAIDNVFSANTTPEVPTSEPVNSANIPVLVNQEEVEPSRITSENGYWLRLLGDDTFLAQEAQANSITPDDLRAIAMANMGYTGSAPPINNIPHVNGTIPGDNMKTSEAYTNTGRHGEGWTAEEYEEHTDPLDFQYESVDEEESVRRAMEMRAKEGREGFKDRMMKANKASGAEIDGMMLEWRKLGEEARALEAAGQDASDVWHESVRVFRKIQELSTESAQGLQALAKWSRNTPEGMLAKAENIINGKDKTDQSKLQKLLDKIEKKNKKTHFSENFVIQFLKEAEKLQGLAPDSQEAKEIMATLGKMINSQVPSNFGEKLTAYLMDNMLGNFRTLITRNAGGNVGLNIVEQLVQRPIAAGIDSLLSIKTGQRTQAGLTKDGLIEYMQGFAKGIKDEARDFKTGLHTARTGQNTLENAIASNRHVFKNRIADRLDSLVKQGLSVGDRPFYEAVYKQTMGDYNRLRDAGKLSPALQNLDDANFELYAKAAAEMNALGAVYQQDSMLSKALLEFKGAVGDLSKGVLGADILSQFSMPFVKTPANVIERAIDYSPLGFARNAFRTHRERKNQKFDQNRFVNETARNILGTALMGGGVGLAAKGALSGGYSDDKDEKQAQKESGEQEYALNIGDKQVDINWVPVVGSNNVAAAAAYNAAKNGEGNVFENAATGLKAGGQALFDQSMFQGLQRLFGTGESYNSDEGIVGNMGNVVKSGLGQGIPSLFRQSGQVIDPYQRDVGNSNEGKSFAFLDNYDINNLINNVPFLREKALAPKVGTSGELLKENQGRSVPSKILEDMILPGKVTKVEYSELNKEAMRLKEETNNADGYMPKATRKGVDTEDHTLTNKEWTEYQQRYYKELTDAGTKLLNSDFYKNADAATQVKTLKYAYDGVRYAINSEYTGKDISGASKEYVDAGGGKKGVDAVIKYCRENIEADELGVDRSTYHKKEKEKPGSGKEWAKDTKQADKLGLDVSTYRRKEEDEKGGAAKFAAEKQKKIQEMGGEEKVKEMKESANDIGISVESYDKIVKQAGDNADKVLKAVPGLKRNGLKSTNAYLTFANALKEVPSLTSAEFVRTFNEIDADDSRGVSQGEVFDYLNTHDVKDPQKFFDTYILPENRTNKKGMKKKVIQKDGKYSGKY